MIRAGIIGGADKIAGELIGILINHPDVEIAWVNDPKASGNLIADTHRQLIGETYMRFTDTANWSEIDVLFLCTPEGQSKSLIASAIIPERIRIIDLSGDYRMDGDASGFVYGIPELNRKALVRGATRVANPSAMASVIALSLLPLAKNLLLNADITAIAVTAASDTAVIERSLGHKQVEEISVALTSLQQSFKANINFTPIRGIQERGIQTVCYLQCPLDLEQIIRLYEDFYSDHSFTFITRHIPHPDDVANTNKCLIHLSKVDGYLVINAVADNLIKGAAGQAVHNMNLLFGLHERVGLTLKSAR